MWGSIISPSCVRPAFRPSRLLGINRSKFVYAVPIPIAITQPIVWIVRPDAQARPDLSRGRSTVRQFGTRVAHIASFAPLGVAFMYLYRTVQASPQPCQPDSKRPQV